MRHKEITVTKVERDLQVHLILPSTTIIILKPYPQEPYKVLLKVLPFAVTMKALAFIKNSLVGLRRVFKVSMHAIKLSHEKL